MSFNITPVASGYQEIHPYSAMNIDSVKINTSLIMMKECMVLHCWLRRAGCISQDTYLLYYINTRGGVIMVEENNEVPNN